MSNRALVSVLTLALVAPALPLLSGAGAASGAPTYTTYAGPASNTDFVVFGGTGGEPSVGVDWATDTILYQHGFSTLRVELADDGGSEWIDVSSLTTPFNIDPMLFTDSATGRTWAGGLDGMCSSMAITEDGGESWIPAGNMCVPTLDHQTIGSGPFAAPVPENAVIDRATYYCAQASAVTCISSLDGGLTWGPPVPVSCGFINPGFHGSVHVGPNGHVYLPFRDCGGGPGVAVSLNNGVTWTARVVPGTTHPGAGFDPDVATTPSGWLYMGFASGTVDAGRSYVSLSKNDGLTWSTPFDVGASLGVVSSTFHEMVAGDDDRAAVAFLGTTTPGNPYAASVAGVWDLYIATTYDAGATWTTVKVSDDPVQRGWICSGGIGCSTGRNLLDFMDAQVDARGRILVAHADGCIDACALPGGTASQSTANRATLVRQSAGLTLFSAFDPQSGALLASGYGPYTGPAGAPIQLTGSALGEAPYEYAWSVVTRPQGSAAGAASFSDPNASSPTFTADVLGTYALRFEARDAAGDVASDVVTLRALAQGGAPLPECSTSVATDPEGDSAATGAGIGRRDITLLRASDGGSIVTFCVDVADMASAPTAGSQFSVSWEAPYEAPGITYIARATVGANGGISSAQLLKGAGGVGVAALGGPAFAELEGDTLKIIVTKPAIGGPAAGEQATSLVVVVENTATPTTTYDRAPGAGGASFTFGAAVPDSVAPSTVATLDAEDAATGGAVDLAWSAATDDVSLQDYVVRRSSVSGGPYRTVGVTSDLSFHDAGLEDGVSYHYVVAARDSAGNIGLPSPEASVTPTGPGGGGADTTPPSAVVGLAAPTVGAGAIELSWGAATDAESGVALYRVSKDGTQVGTTTATSYHLEGLSALTTYTLGVRAVNGEGLLGPLSTISVTTTARPPDCGQSAGTYEIAADAIGDATRSDGRADLARFSVRETATRVYFHVGLDNLTASAPDTLVRVSWRTDDARGWAAQALVTDAGASPRGLFLTAAGQDVNAVRQPTLQIRCDTLIIGVQWADVLDPAEGERFLDLAVTTSPEASVAQPYDGTAPADYVIGTA